MAGALTRTRRNHAIEHATIAVLAERQGHAVTALARSDQRGFSIWSAFDEEIVASAVSEAIDRLISGERSLAVTNNCGTNILVTGFMAGTAALVFAGRNRWSGWPAAMAAATIAVAGAMPVGRWIQRHATVDAEIGDTIPVSIREVGRRAGRHAVRVTLAGD